MDFDFEELYQAVILDHSRRPRNFGPLEGATVTVAGDNPSCGDELALSLKVDPAEDRIAGIGFTGSGCSGLLRPGHARGRRAAVGFPRDDYR